MTLRQDADNVVAKKALSDLEPTETARGSNLIEPTLAEIEEVVALIAGGKTAWQVKREWKRAGSHLSLTVGQIATIDQARKARIAETKAEEEVVDDGLEPSR